MVKQLSSTDCQSMYEMLGKDTSMPKEKRVALDLYDVRQQLEAGDWMEWVPTGLMMADQLTKHRPWQGPLLDASLGQICWRETQEEASNRRTGLSRHRRQECT